MVMRMAKLIMRPYSATGTRGLARATFGMRDDQCGIKNDYR